MNALPADSPIGIFDSGVGGISVLQAIRHELPAEHLLYVADSGNAPYGNRHTSFIIDRTMIIAKFLIESRVKAIVVACNTATVVAIEALRLWCPIPVVAMEPAIKPAADSTKSGVVGVLATSQTIASPAVARLCDQYGRRAEILLMACPGLVEQVERGELASEVTRSLLVEYLSPLLDAGVDTLVLGCTHYPFLSALIQDIVGPNVSIVDPAAAVARQLARRLDANLRLAPPGDSVSEYFFSSDQVERAHTVMSILLGKNIVVRSFDK
ncbi:MAG: glutamate racemase [Methylococcales bacterium]|nr:glutamate racemase [Methylococcales bacterium]